MSAMATPVLAPVREARHAELGLTEKDVLRMFELMILARTLDERMWVLQRQGKIAFVISGQGQEGCQVGSAYALRPGVDWVHPYYRDMAVVLTLGMTAHDLMLSAFGKFEDPSSGGRQMPAHFGDPRHKIISGSSPVITQVVQAAGIALASKIRGEDVVTVTYFGEGATASGDFHEGLNWAGIHKLPVIFICENNLYAISEHQSKEMAISNVADRAVAYGFPGVTVDGNDVLAVYEATKRAVERARSGAGPTLIEAKTYRLIPHSSDDDDRIYRTRQEVEGWKQRDPIVRLRQYLQEQAILTDALERDIKARAQAIVDDATDYAERAPYPNPEDGLKDVYAEAR